MHREGDRLFFFAAPRLCAADRIWLSTVRVEICINSPIREAVFPAAVQNNPSRWRAVRTCPVFSPRTRASDRILCHQVCNDPARLFSQSVGQIVVGLCDAQHDRFGPFIPHAARELAHFYGTAVPMLRVVSR
jgi:hypothetical protein